MHAYALARGPVRLLVVTAPPREPDKDWGGFVADIESSAELIAVPPASRK